MTAATKVSFRVMGWFLIVCAWGLVADLLVGGLAGTACTFFGWGEGDWVVSDLFWYYLAQVFVLAGAFLVRPAIWFTKDLRKDMKRWAP